MPDTNARKQAAEKVRWQSRIIEAVRIHYGERFVVGRGYGGDMELVVEAAEAAGVKAEDILLEIHIGTEMAMRR